MDTRAVYPVKTVVTVTGAAETMNQSTVQF